MRGQGLLALPVYPLASSIEACPVCGLPGHPCRHHCCRPAPADIYTDLNDFDAAAKYYDKYIERMNADSVV